MSTFRSMTLSHGRVGMSHKQLPEMPLYIGIVYTRLRFWWTSAVVEKSLVKLFVLIADCITLFRITVWAGCGIFMAPTSRLCTG